MDSSIVRNRNYNEEKSHQLTKIRQLDEIHANQAINHDYLLVFKFRMRCAQKYRWRLQFRSECSVIFAANACIDAMNFKRISIDEYHLTMN